MVSLAARLLGVSRTTFYEWIDTRPEIALAVKDARELTKDQAEISLFKAIDKGEAWAVCFFLKTQARDRGYIERYEHGGGLTNLNVGATVQDVMAMLEQSESFIDASRELHAMGIPALPGPGRELGKVSVSAPPGGHRSGRNGRATGNGSKNNHG